MFKNRYTMRKFLNSTSGEGDGGAGGTSAGESGSGGAGGAGEGEGEGKDKVNSAAGGEKGKSGPTDEEARLLKENMKRKEELRKKEDELASLKKQFEGIDPEAVRKLLAEQKTAEEKQLEARGDYERLKQRMAEEHGTTVKSLNEQIAALQGELGKTKGTINELSIGTQFGQSTFIAEELTLTPAKARVIYADHFDLEDGKVVGYDKVRGSANRTALVDQYGSPIPFDAALRKIIDADPEKDYLLKSKTKAGAGSDSKKVASEPAKDQPIGSVSKIAAGLKGLVVTG